jgi:hypothetical protein
MERKKMFVFIISYHIIIPYITITYHTIYFRTYAIDYTWQIYIYIYIYVYIYICVDCFYVIKEYMYQINMYTSFVFFYIKIL